MQELDFAKSMAKTAGDIMLKNFGDTRPLFKTGERAAANKTINSLVIDEVKKHFPGHAVMSQDENYTIKLPTYTWVSHPIDGILPYMLGVPTNVFSLALLDEKGMPIIAVVYDPYLEKCYWASRDNGAFMNGTKLGVDHTKKIQDALIGNSGRSSSLVDAQRFKTHLYNYSYRPIVLHSVVYEAMLVASGKIAATVMTGRGPYNTACAKLIVEEAGGKVTDLFGSEQRYDRDIKGVIMSNGVIHTEIVKLAESCRIR